MGVQVVQAGRSGQNGADHTDAQADGRRATKQDILSVDVKLKKENAEIKKEIAEVRNENSEMRSSLERMEKDLKKILSAMSPESK